jgi:hypothetical protein
VKPAVRPLLAVAGLVLTVSACASDPSPTRVAQDLIKTVESDPEVQACMLDVVEDFDLDQLGKDATSDNADMAAAANAELDEYQAALEACR